MDINAGVSVLCQHHSCIHNVRRLCYKGPPRYLRLNVSSPVPQSTGIVVSKALGWIVFTTLHNLRILNSSRTTSHAPLSSYSLQSHGTTLHSFSAAESLLVNLRLTCALCVPGPGLTITQPRRISIWRDGAWVLGSARHHRLSYFCYCMEWVL